MRKIFDFALICAIVVAVVYACSEDYFAPYEENLELNAHDPRLELIAEIDSAKLQESGVETLALGENMVDVNQQIMLTKEIKKFHKHDQSSYISMTVTVLAATDSLNNFIYPSYYQEIQGYPVTVTVSIPKEVGSGVHWAYSSSRATIISPRTIMVEVRGVFADYMGYFRENVYENVNVDVEGTLGLY